MNDYPTEAAPVAEALFERLGTTAQAAYLYGSVVRGSRHARDLDLLLVVSSVDHTEVYAAIAALQVRNTILIHPTVISPHELHSNPLFRELVDSSIMLWQESLLAADDRHSAGELTI